MRWLLIFSFSLFFFIINSTTPNASSSALSKEINQRELSRNPIWLKLLHYDKKKIHSKILTDEFFLSPNGKQDPEAELLATIDAYFLPWGDNPDNHPRCVYPARYYWLSQHLDLPNYTLREPQCTRFEKWALLDTVKSVSLLLVSGYFGNPASTFGHSLIKLNTDSVDDTAGFFDLSINYGALVPENEATLRYVIRGLLGGYQAGFSDKYYYTQDLVYSHTQFRDIWDYELNLSDYERTLLILHIWEIVGKKFKYYFLTKNCAYMLAELLEVVINEPLIENSRAWYLPVETFYRISQIDAIRQGNGLKGLIKSLRFIPSSHRKLYHQLGHLTPKEIKTFNSIIEENSSDISKKLAPFEEERQVEILNAVLEYHQYRLIAEEPEPNIKRREAKNKVLLARLRLPPELEPTPEVPALESPAQGNRPMLTSVGVGNESNEGTYMRIRWSPFSQESVGQNSLEGNELVVFDTTIGIDKEYNLFIDQIDLIRIRTLKTMPLRIADENPWSWQLHVGVLRTEHNEQIRTDGIFSFGAGYAWKLNNYFSVYSMIDADAHSLSPYVRIRPNLGVIINLGVLKSWLHVGVENRDYNFEVKEVWGGKVQYQLMKQMALGFEISAGNTTKKALGLNWYW